MVLNPSLLNRKQRRHGLSPCPSKHHQVSLAASRLMFDIPCSLLKQSGSPQDGNDSKRGLCLKTDGNRGKAAKRHRVQRRKAQLVCQVPYSNTHPVIQDFTAYGDAGHPRRITCYGFHPFGLS